MGLGLYDYQKEAVKKMHNGCILNGTVGSGKSRTGLAYYFKENGGDIESEDYVPMSDPPKDLYIITTAKKRDTDEWEADMSPFLLSSKHPENNIYNHKVVVDSWNNIVKYIDVQDAFFIFDEQRLVGSGTWVKAFYKIAKKNDWILLTATPGDCWQDYIPVFVANGFYKNKTEFNQEHIVWSPYTKFPKVARYLNEGRLIKFRNDLLISMEDLRTTIPHHEYINCTYDTGEYRQTLKNRWNYNENKPVESLAELFHLLRKICNESPDRQVKLLEIFEEHPKIIVFYNFDYELELLRYTFSNITNEVAEWNGHKHQPIPTGDSWAYLVQYKAGCEGWNCITTDTIVFFSQNYSYKTLNQACGRIDRLNTPYRDLYYYHLRSTSGIDLAISNSLNKKQEFNERKYASKLNLDFKGENKNER